MATAATCSAASSRRMILNVRTKRLVAGCDLGPAKRLMARAASAMASETLPARQASDVIVLGRAFTQRTRALLRDGGALAAIGLLFSCCFIGCLTCFCREHLKPRQMQGPTTQAHGSGGAFTTS